MIPYVTSDQVSAVSNALVAVAACLAAWQGIKSLQLWRRERVGGRRIELAEEALFELYRAQNAIRSIRSPLSYSSEHEGREKEDHESPAQARGREQGYTVFERIKRHQQQFDALYVISLRVKAVFGDIAFAPFGIVRTCFGRVRVSAQMLYDTPYEGYEDREFRQKLERDIWDIDSEDPDSIEQKMKRAVTNAEEILAPYLKIN
ncbi:MAG TPA: hypothetical protein PKD48_08650 [Sphingopyxis sp.]|nr:hypothetical protein [Sphingopyxis sp.]HMQ17957.1 hypothetical protein [Sphingopyxis sp.]